jgi:hypothetical protein
MRHEDNLINARVSWLVNSQSFLFGVCNHPEWQRPIQIPILRKTERDLGDLATNGGNPGSGSELPDHLGRHPAHQKSSPPARGKSPPHLLPLHGEVSIGRMGLSGAVLIPVIFLACGLRSSFKLGLETENNDRELEASLFPKG